MYEQGKIGITLRHEHTCIGCFIAPLLKPLHTGMIPAYLPYRMRHCLINNQMMLNKTGMAGMSHCIEYASGTW